MLLLRELVLVFKALPAHLGVGVPHEPVPPLPGLSPEVGAHARVRLVLTAKLGREGILFFNKYPLDLRAGAGDSCPLVLPFSLVTAVLATAGAGAGARVTTSAPARPCGLTATTTLNVGQCDTCIHQYMYWRAGFLLRLHQD